MPPMRLIVKLLVRAQRKPRDGASQGAGLQGSWPLDGRSVAVRAQLRDAFYANSAN